MARDLLSGAENAELMVINAFIKKKKKKKMIFIYFHLFVTPRNVMSR